MTSCARCGTAPEDHNLFGDDCENKRIMYWQWCDACAADQHTFHPHPKGHRMLYTILIILLIVLAVAAIIYFVRRTPRNRQDPPAGPRL